MRLVVLPLILCFSIFGGLLLSYFFLNEKKEKQTIEYFDMSPEVQFNYAKQALRNINEQILIPLIESNYDTKVLQERKHIIEGFQQQLQSAYY